MNRKLNLYGALCGILAPIVFLVFYLVAVIQSPSYVFGEHFLSDLGVAEGAWAFNTGVVMVGILSIPFCLGLWYSLRPGWLLLIGSVVGIAAGVLLIGVGIFTEHYGDLHFTVSVLFFAFAAFFQISLAYPLIRNPKTKTTGWAVTILMLITVLIAGGFIPTPLLETIAVFEILIWTLVVALQIFFISTREIKYPTSTKPSREN
jgi:hypothetical membrane protein